MPNGDVPEGWQKYPVTSPDGIRLWVTAPKGTPDDQIKQYAAQQRATNPGKIKENAALTIPEAFLTGMADPIYGGAQLASHIFRDPQEAMKADVAIKGREADIAARGGGGVARGVGAAVTQAPLALAAGAMGPAGAVAGGAASGALSPVANARTPDDYWAQKEKDALFGAAFGFAGGGMAASSASRLVRPEARSLIQQGIDLTPGQMVGGPVRRLEEAARSVPILGSFIRGGEGRGVGAFNRALGNQALESIGGRLPAGVEGRAAVGEVERQLSGAYDQLLPQMTVQMDANFANTMHQIRNNAGELPPAMQQQFNTILENRLARFFIQPQGGAPVSVMRQGGNLKEAEGALRDIANRYRASTDPDQRTMAALLDDTRGALRDALIRQNPQHADALRNIDRGWAILTRLQDASVRSKARMGNFTPADLLNAIAKQDKTVRKSAFARGDAMLQDYAETAQRILPGTLPDSGTTERYLWDAALLGIGGGGAEVGGHGGAVLPALAGLTAAGLPYTRQGLGALNAPFRNQALGQSTLGRVAPYAAVAGQPLVGGEPDPPEYGGPQQ
jgi:hypothetical protein